MKLLPFLTPALAAAAATLCIGIGAAQAATARPDAGNGFAVSLATSATDPYVGTSVTLTAATVSESSTGSHQFEAFIGDDRTGHGAPGFVLVSSNQVGVLWWRFIRIGQLSPAAG